MGEYIRADKYISFKLRIKAKSKAYLNKKSISISNLNQKSNPNPNPNPNIFKNCNGIYKFLHGDCLKKLSLDFLVCSQSDDGIIYAIKHKKLPIYGSQFHPELSGEIGEHILTNFLRLCGY